MWTFCCIIKPVLRIKAHHAFGNDTDTWQLQNHSGTNVARNEKGLGIPNPLTPQFWTAVQLH